jgi:hypothetical protein
MYYYNSNMPTIQNIRFHKFDQYSAIFISNKRQEPETYEQLKKYYERLYSDYPDKFLPIFNSDINEYSSIRFKISKDFDTLNNNDVVKINFAIKRSNAGNVYCQLIAVRLIKEASPDEELDLSDVFD